MPCHIGYDRSPKRRHHRDPDEFLGLDLEDMSPKAQAVTGVVVGGIILTGVGLLLVFHPQFFWLIFVFGWLVFPAIRLFARGIAGLADAREMSPAKAGKERELLRALQARGELTPAQAALETSLSVAEADEMMKGLAEGGHLDVRVHGGALYYSLWKEKEEETRGG
ncbi:MAG: hypothetical protein K6T51_04210 [Rubrobacteraceae bacterium]|uniref:hypothetical protein n=1 Tax=Rubrobacter naiadicus TaxID=1392641 RepID=UPI00235FA40F|nr:hypothetical protein [Rubrobacter naiadicus]MBX6762079.1 hypothetical protein [Rubrobacteraceae bacterium]MCL6437793.1 hypothetical protein [Rubrobacteraceae bacterium]